MATSAPMQPIVVVGPQYLAPYPVDLTVASRLLSVGDCNFGVTDSNGAVLFRVKSKLLSIRDRRYLFDAAGKILATFQKKIITAHGRWNVYRGDSTNSRDEIFSVTKSSLIQFKTELNVFLAANTSENMPDFKIKGSWFDRSCTIFHGPSNTILAQMHKEYSVSTIVLDKEKFGVTVYPNVDYAFIVSLIVILDQINGNLSVNDLLSWYPD